MEKDVLPRLISWPIIACLWGLLGILLTAGFFTWYAQVPTYVSGSGIVLAQGDTLQPAYGETMAIVFLPPDQSAHLRAGQPVDLQIGSTTTHVQSTIARVEPGIISPNAARQRYQLVGTGALIISQPSIVAIINLGAALPNTAFAGSLLNARVETDTQRLLTLLLGSGQFPGGGS